MRLSTDSVVNGTKVPASKDLNRQKQWLGAIMVPYSKHERRSKRKGTRESLVDCFSLRSKDGTRGGDLVLDLRYVYGLDASRCGATTVNFEERLST